MAQGKIKTKTNTKPPAKKTKPTKVWKEFDVLNYLYLKE